CHNGPELSNIILHYHCPLYLSSSPTPLGGCGIHFRCSLVFLHLSQEVLQWNLHGQGHASERIDVTEGRRRFWRKVSKLLKDELQLVQLQEQRVDLDRRAITVSQRL